MTWGERLIEWYNFFATSYLLTCEFLELMLALPSLGAK